MSRNPFPQSRRPVLGAEFVGRRDLLHKFRAHLDKDWPESVAVVGPTAIGKSSLLQQVVADLRTLPDAVVVSPPANDWLADDPTPALFLSTLTRRVEAEVTAAGVAFDGHDPDDPVRSLATATRRAGRRLYLVLDRFERVVRRWNLGARELGGIRAWASRVDTQVGLVVASAEGLDRFPSSFQDSRLASVFARVASLGPLTAEDVAALVDRGAELRLPDGAAAAVWQQCGGHPFLSNLAAGVLADRVLEGRRVDLSDPGWVADLDAIAAEGLRQIVADVALAHAEGLRTLVAENFSVGAAEAREAAEALAELGFLQRHSSHAFRCAGAVYRRFLVRTYGAGTAEEVFATPQERASFGKGLADTEPRMREYVERELERRKRTVADELPREVVVRARARGRDGPLVDNITFGELVQLLQKVAPRASFGDGSLGRLGMVTGTQTVRDVRNGIAHNVEVRREALARAVEELRQVQRFLNDWVS